MEAILVSAGLVALAEIGDKTQLLAIILAARFRKPLPIILGILGATILNHTTAAAIGYFVAQWLTGRVFQTFIGIAFIAMAVWALIPDKAEEDQTRDMGHYGVFVATLIAFFVVEIGDKTQLATSLLAARFHSIGLVTVGTTLGMLLADAPAVLLGDAITRIAPLKYVRLGAALVFALIGLWVLVATYV